MNQLAEWIPIVKMTKYETFESANPSTQTVVGNVFIGVSLMILATVFTLIFYWAYQKEKHLFVAILCGVVFLYAIEVVILVATLRDKLNRTVFKLYMGSTVFIAFMMLILIVFFSIKASQRLRSSSSSPYVPPPVQAYNNQDM
jgi:ABC-type transport system involved in cytochrome c biogenesis permease subunit